MIMFSRTGDYRSSSHVLVDCNYFEYRAGDGANAQLEVPGQYVSQRYSLPRPELHARLSHILPATTLIQRGRALRRGVTLQSNEGELFKFVGYGTSYGHCGGDGNPNHNPNPDRIKARIQVHFFCTYENNISPCQCVVFVLLLPVLIPVLFLCSLIIS
jgi:hypothetical protein